MILFVDYEHERAHDSTWGEKLLAARTRITYRLEDLAGQHCMLVRYDRVTPALVRTLDVQALFISGNGTNPSHYSPEGLAPLHAMIRDAEVPIFGFCGGFQCIAEALGSAVVQLEPDAEEGDAGESTDDSNGEASAQSVRRGPVEFGYLPVDVTADHPVLAGLGQSPVFRHAHSLHVPSPPEGFEVMASTSITPVQLAIHDDHRIVGTQFHPEYWTDEHPDGETMIANFLKWSGVTQ